MTAISKLSSAYRRAKHFGVPSDGPFTVVGVDGPCIAARNYSAFIAASDDAADQLGWFSDWVRSINRYCDSHKVAGDMSAAWAFGSFLSQLWLDPTKL